MEPTPYSNPIGLSVGARCQSQPHPWKRLSVKKNKNGAVDSTYRKARSWDLKTKDEP
jgi:hypothetical protein